MKPILIMLVGLPGVGKSHIAKGLLEQGYTVHSSDKIREELGDVNDQSNNSKVFEILGKRVKEDLQNGQDTVYDATNISYKKRMAFLKELKNIKCVKTCLWVYGSYEFCLKNNSERERKVPEEVITRMYKNFNVPYYYEGWDMIAIYRNEAVLPTKDAKWFYSNYANFSQDNKHHELTLTAHMRKSYLYAKKDTVAEAALLHDIGKPFTKKLTDSKGNPTEDAHYYNHHYVGAYDSIDYDFKSFVAIGSEDFLGRAVLIMWHMQPYFWERDNNEKQCQKYRELWGENLYEMIMDLHQADRKAQK